MKKSRIMLAIGSIALAGAVTLPTAMAQPAFADMDANQDGYLTQDELDTFRQNRIKQRADTGGQLRNVGKNSQSGLLQKYDADKDGRLSEAEFNQFRADRMGQRSGMRGKQGKMGQMRGTPVTFADLDLNKDGKITPAEARQAQQQRMNARMQVNAEQREQRQNAWFQFLDSNKDGSISQSEFDAMQQQRRGPAR